MKHLPRFFFFILLTAGFSQVVLSDDNTAEQPTIVQAASLVTTSYSCQDIYTGKNYVVSFLNMEGASTPELASKALQERHYIEGSKCQSTADLAKQANQSGETVDLSDANIVNKVGIKLQKMEAAAETGGLTQAGYSRSEALGRDVYVSEIEADMGNASAKLKSAQVLVWTLALSAAGLAFFGTSLIPAVITITVAAGTGLLVMALDSHFGATKAFAMAGLKLGHDYLLQPVYSRAWSYLVKPGLYYGLSGIFWVLHWFAPEGIQTVQDFILPKLAPAAKVVAKVN
ncbi:hypothetical protein [Endozoicomonas arenosclerae]|uniref:hypothetical protein n=1 Tax=Endozoicomonas arenosclerae TaxID=1633495 RepID=UPI0007849AC4|nr:hypothetical protein [Endozoicomonas arenosclerae]